MPSDDTSARLTAAAASQSLFRNVNELVGELHDPAMIGRSGDWLCECLDTSCVARLELTLDEYEAIRSDGNRFAVKPGHEVPEVERVVASYDGYLVVAKHGVGGEHAIELDPRRTSL
jgi:hypothetical protein